MEFQTFGRHSGKKVEFSKSPKRPEGSEENASSPDGDNQETTLEQLKPFRRSVRVMVPSTRYG